jgi:hypothetical protein
MIFGMDLGTYTLIHVLISLVGITTGAVVMTGMICNMRLHWMTSIFLASTTITSVTGFGFPFEKLLPSHILGVLSLAVLTLAYLARYKYAMADGWRKTYIISASAALFFNVFVLIVQSFKKIPELVALNLTEPFLPIQLPVLAAFVVLTYVAVKKFQK